MATDDEAVELCRRLRPELVGELPNRYDDLAFSLVTGHGGVYLVASDAAWRLDLRDPTRWVRLPDPPLGPGRGGAPLVTWTDAGLLTANGDGAALYDGGSWRSVPAPPVDVDAEASAVVGDDGMVVAVDPRSGAAAAFEATREQWATLPDVPLRPRFNAAVAGGTDGKDTVVLVPIKVVLGIMPSAVGPARVEIRPLEPRTCADDLRPERVARSHRARRRSGGGRFSSLRRRDRGLATAYNGGFLVDGPRSVGIIVADEGMTTSRPSTHRSASAGRAARCRSNPTAYPGDSASVQATRRPRGQCRPRARRLTSSR